MMKKVLIICIFFIISVGLFFLPKVHAANVSEIFTTADDWLSTGKGKANMAMKTDELEKMSDQLYNIFLAVATGVAVIIGAILGIQFMTAGIDKRVQVKESLYPYLISCVVVFGSLGIWKLAVYIFRDI